MNPSILLVGLALLGAPQDPAKTQDPVVIRVVRDAPLSQTVPTVHSGVVNLRPTPSTSSLPNLLDETTYEETTIVGTGVGCESAGCACGDGCSGGCDDGCGQLMRYDLRHPPTNMVPHLPYDAQPKTYYYFRPYNWMHIHQHQGEAAIWNAPAGNPYSNKIFQDVYESIEIEEIAGDSIEE